MAFVPVPGFPRANFGLVDRYWLYEVPFLEIDKKDRNRPLNCSFYPPALLSVLGSAGLDDKKTHISTTVLTLEKHRVSRSDGMLAATLHL